MLDIEEAKAIMKRGLGKAELELVASFTAPLAWVIRRADNAFATKNGSTFFLNAGAGPFGVTAAHVISELARDQAEPSRRRQLHRRSRPSHARRDRSRPPRK
jgi:hypothetical protein